MTTWLIHRITGLLLIALLATKFLTAYFLLGEDKPSWALSLHRQPVVDMTLIVAIALHACFGLKTLLFEIGLRREVLLTRGAWSLAALLSAAGVVCYLVAG